jgi:hypothetical protein
LLSKAFTFINLKNTNLYHNFFFSIFTFSRSKNHTLHYFLLTLQLSSLSTRFSNQTSPFYIIFPRLQICYIQKTLHMNPHLPSFFHTYSYIPLEIQSSCILKASKKISSFSLFFILQFLPLEHEKVGGN